MLHPGRVAESGDRVGDWRTRPGTLWNRYPHWVDRIGSVWAIVIWARIWNAHAGSAPVKHSARSHVISAISGEIGITVLPASDDTSSTRVYTDDGEMTFQEYFVHRQCRPVVKEFRFVGHEHATPGPGSAGIAPMRQISLFSALRIPGLALILYWQFLTFGQAVESRPVVAVSPINRRRGRERSGGKNVCRAGHPDRPRLPWHSHYRDLLDGFVFDRIDVDEVGAISQLGIQPYSTDILMQTPADRRRLAKEVIDFSFSMIANHLETRPLGIQ